MAIEEFFNKLSYRHSMKTVIPTCWKWQSNVPFNSYCDIAVYFSPYNWDMFLNVMNITYMFWHGLNRSTFNHIVLTVPLSFIFSRSTFTVDLLKLLGNCTFSTLILLAPATEMKLKLKPKMPPMYCGHKVKVLRLNKCHSCPEIRDRLWSKLRSMVSGF